MVLNEPAGVLDPRFSSDGAPATTWTEAREQLQNAMVFWLSTVRSDGRPHVTSIATIWMDDTLHFTMGEREQKARNLVQNSHCVVTTGCNDLRGLDIVVEGDAVRLTDDARLERLVTAYVAKYGQLFLFSVDHGVLHATGAEEDDWAYALRPTRVFGFAKGELFSQTRWRFSWDTHRRA
jgi:hypothetical protein